MRSILLFLIIPVFSSGQWGTPPPVVTDEECKAEMDTIAECFTDKDLFNKMEKIADSPLLNETEVLEMIEQMSHILDCSGQVNCNVTRMAQSFIHNQQWILVQLTGRLKSCLTDTGLLHEIRKQCGTQQTVAATDECDLGSVTSCAMEIVKKHPNSCSREQRKLVLKVLNAFRASCLMSQQIRVEKKKHDLEDVTF